MQEGGGPSCMVGVCASDVVDSLERADVEAVEYDFSA